ncbi:hypothetical protein FACS1894132_02430 [Clostridia bacterium]|nr:hypothetical protein FACS1894132_02430 [Clostridia bacterium]
MGVLSNTLNAVKSLLVGSSNHVYTEYQHQQFENIDDEIFGVFSIVTIKGQERLIVQNIGILPMNLTIGFTVYAKKEQQYANILDFIDTKILTPIAETSLNLVSLHIPPVIYNSNFKRNVVKCEFTVQCSYKG